MLLYPKFFSPHLKCVKFVANTDSLSTKESRKTKIDKRPYVSGVNSQNIKCFDMATWWCYLSFQGHNIIFKGPVRISWPTNI